MFSLIAETTSLNKNEYLHIKKKLILGIFWPWSQFLSSYMEFLHMVCNCYY